MLHELATAESVHDPRLQEDDLQVEVSIKPF